MLYSLNKLGGVMSLKDLRDKELNLNLLKMVQHERKLTSQILDYLKEVEDRMLFAKRGYPSLFSYCTEFLGYSESAAQRRISSMRLLKEVPQIKEQITSGALSLSNISKAASFFRQEKKLSQKTYTPIEKNKILQSLQGKTQKQAEEELVKINPRTFQNIDKQRVVSSEITELRLTLDKKTMEKLNRLKELKPDLGTQELLDWMLSRCLKQVDPLEKPKRILKPEKKSLPQRTRPRTLRRPISKTIRYQVWQKAKASCEFKDHINSRYCKSKTGLEIDHVQPLSLGGSDDLNNLRLLCREHHKLVTQQSFKSFSFKKQLEL